MKNLAKILEQSKSAGKHVILTVPHAVLDFMHEEHEKNVHPFDWRAKKVAKAIYQELGSHKISVDLLLSDVPRKILDLNREESRGYQWRKEVIARIEKGQENGEDIYLFDIHSFGNEDRDEWKDEAIVVMDGTLEKDAIVAKLKEVKENIRHIDVKKRDDIVIMAQKAGAEALLLEFNESEEIISEQDIKKVAEKIREYVEELDV
jgi:sirohydrochlorin ferrochelatase